MNTKTQSNNLKQVLDNDSKLNVYLENVELDDFRADIKAIRTELIIDFIKSRLKHKRKTSIDYCISLDLLDLVERNGFRLDNHTELVKAIIEADDDKINELVDKL